MQYVIIYIYSNQIIIIFNHNFQRKITDGSQSVCDFRSFYQVIDVSVARFALGGLSIYSLAPKKHLLKHPRDDPTSFTPKNQHLITNSNKKNKDKFFILPVKNTE